MRQAQSESRRQTLRHTISTSSTLVVKERKQSLSRLMVETRVSMVASLSDIKTLFLLRMESKSTTSAISKAQQTSSSARLLSLGLRRLLLLSVGKDGSPLLGVIVRLIQATMSSMVLQSVPSQVSPLLQAQHISADHGAIMLV
jgi:hypothetical protein